MQKFNDNIYKNQRNEEQIMSNWRGNINNPKVTILCTTYNHEKYIEDSINGFLIQETDFEFEILIHDDASTDNTANIIKKYEQMYPKIIKPIYQKENQYSKGSKYFWDLLFSNAKGKYIAICEGDDYWTDSTKLQKQVDFLKDNKKYMACYHNTGILRENKNKNNLELISNTIKDIFKIEDFAKGKIYFHTSSLIFRFNDKIKKKIITHYSHKNFGDRFLSILLASLGPIKYINRVMSVYRIHNNGVWSSLSREKQAISNLSILIQAYNTLGIEYRDYFLESFLINFKTKDIDKNNIIETTKELLKDETKESLIEKISRTTKLKNNYFNILFSKKLNVIYSKLENLKNNLENFIIYGSGTGMDLVLSKLCKSKILFAVDIDENKNNLIKNDIKIISLSNFKNHDNKKTKIIITVFGRADEIKENLITTYKVDKNRIISLDILDD